MSILLNHDEIVDLVDALGDKVFILVLGENGCSKTSTQKTLIKRERFSDFIKMDPIECTQLSDGSVWMPDIDRSSGVSRELPNERFGLSHANREGVDGSKPIVYMLDEVLKVPQYIKNVLSSIIYERRLGAMHFVKGSIGYGCSNLTEEGLGDALQAHFRSRLMIVRQRKPTSTEWTNWAVTDDIAPEVIAWVHMEPRVLDSFLDYREGGKYAGKDQAKDDYGQVIYNPNGMQDGFVSPRTLELASHVVKRQDKVSPNTLLAALEGTLGTAGAAKFGAVLRFGAEIPLYERVIADPAKCPLPTNPTAQLVQVFQFVTRVADRTEAASVTKYVCRMRHELQSVFCNSIANSQGGAIVKFATAPGFGELMTTNRCFFSSK